MGLRDQKKDKTRADILAAAEDLFRRQGFGETRMQDIAAEIPVSVPTLYNYFASKETILTQIAIDRYSREAVVADQMTREYLEPEDDTPRLERFKQLLRWGLRALASDRDFLGLVVMHTRLMRGAPTADDDASALHAQLGETNLALTHMYETLQKHGELRDDVPARTMTELHTVVLNDRTCRWLESGSEDVDDLEADALGALEILFRGFAPLQGDPS